jgi:hypothetical protein
MSGNNHNSDNEKIDTTKFLYAFTQRVLDSNKSIRWVAITDQDGNIINEQNRGEEYESHLTKEENQESAINTIIRQKTRTKFEPKIGKLSYALGRYQKLSRCLIPINENNFYLILTMDFDQYDFDKIITEKIIPLIKEEKEKFVISNKKNE